MPTTDEINKAQKDARAKLAARRAKVESAKAAQTDTADNADFADLSTSEKWAATKAKIAEALRGESDDIAAFWRVWESLSDIATAENPYKAGQPNPKVVFQAVSKVFVERHPAAPVTKTAKAAQAVVHAVDERLSAQDAKIDALLKSQQAILKALGG